MRVFLFCYFFVLFCSSFGCLVLYSLISTQRDLVPCARAHLPTCAVVEYDSTMRRRPPGDRPCCVCPPTLSLPPPSSSCNFHLTHPALAWLERVRHIETHTHRLRCMCGCVCVCVGTRAANFSRTCVHHTSTTTSTRAPLLEIGFNREQTRASASESAPRQPSKPGPVERAHFKRTHYEHMSDCVHTRMCVCVSVYFA